MRVSKFIHSCVLVEADGGSILFDPGKFSFVDGAVQPRGFHNLTAILFTHDHPDHADLDHLTTILAANPGALVYGNQETLDSLKRRSIPGTLFDRGTRAIGPFQVQAIYAEHAPILGSEPPANTAYLVDGTLLNPGDSFSPALEAFAGTPALLLPVMAPWEKELEMMAFAERLKPKQVIPVHDGQAKDFFLHLRYKTFKEEFEKRNIVFHELYQPGDSVEL